MDYYNMQVCSAALYWKKKHMHIASMLNLFQPSNGNLLIPSCVTQTGKGVTVTPAEDLTPLLANAVQQA